MPRCVSVLVLDEICKCTMQRLVGLEEVALRFCAVARMHLDVYLREVVTIDPQSVCSLIKAVVHPTSDVDPLHLPFRDGYLHRCRRRLCDWELPIKHVAQ